MCLRLVVLVTLLSGIVGDASAQVVQGVVEEAQSGEPLAGVLVSLLDASDQRVTATLSNAEGGFTLQVGRFGRFRLRAERIGLETFLSPVFELFNTRPREERITMGQRAVEIEGLVVDSRVEECRIDRDNAVQIQRWWQEIRTALDISSVVQEEGLAPLQVERYERAWDPSLSAVVGRAQHTGLGLATRPFVSEEASRLMALGFVQGDPGGSRDYFAPDAEVLLSDAFLAGHCFSLEEGDDERLLGLAFEPTTREVPDIAGTLWVDTVTAELRSLEFRYVERDDRIPENRAGGFVGFEYRPSGAWIVREWYIRMPTLGRDGSDLEVVGYVDVGGRTSPVEWTPTAGGDADAVGAIRGVVWDGMADRGLEGATVELLGTGRTAVTDSAGEFILPRVPVGEYRITFSHPEPAAWGLGPPLTRVDVKESLSSDVRLELPPFRSIAGAICRGAGLRSRAILVGDVVDADGGALADVDVVLAWRDDGDGSRQRAEVRTSIAGHFVACGIPPDVLILVDLRVGGTLIRGFEVFVPPGRVVYRRIQLPLVP